MKTIRPFLLILVLALVLSSCVVKSLHAFYTENLLYYEQMLLGKWQDTEKAYWTVLPFTEVILKENQKKNPSELSKDELSLYHKYQKGYVVNFEKDSTKTSFLVMPFKINDQLFLDFTPIEDSESDKAQNNLFKMHQINTHSLAKLDIVSKNDITIKWLDEDKIRTLLDDQKIKIKHQKVGFGETVLLTASSEELVKFIEKYMNSNDEDKWNTDVEFRLKRE